MDKYEVVQDLDSGSFGIAKLCRHKQTKELVAVKFIERGPMIDENVAREIFNHRSLRHPNVISFKEVVLTPTHLALVMEYAGGGELFQRICNCGRFSDDEARYFFQQLITGVKYCHLMLICHRDLKLDNILLDGSLTPRLKICDFGYSKSSLFHSRPKSTVGSPSYAAPEVLAQGQYDGKLVDMWSCGVTLYVMLVGVYPFDDQNDTRNLEKTYKRIMDVHYTITTDVKISQDCRHLLSHIFVREPSRRSSLRDITLHPWYRKNLSRELTEPAQVVYYKRNNPSLSLQSLEEMMTIVTEARNLPPSSTTNMHMGWETEEDDEVELEEEDGEVELEEEDDETDLEEKEDEVEQEEEDDEAELEEEDDEVELEEEEDEVEQEEEDDEIELEEEENEAKLEEEDDEVELEEEDDEIELEEEDDEIELEEEDDEVDLEEEDGVKQEEENDDVELEEEDDEIELEEEEDEAELEEEDDEVELEKEDDELELEKEEDGYDKMVKEIHAKGEYLSIII